MVIKRIDLHIGHFGDKTGASGYVDEVVEARKFMTRIFNILQSNKVPSTLYEDKISKNKTDNVNHLVKYHNKMSNGLVVSGHLNASSGKVEQGIGTETLYYSEKELAKRVSKSISDASGMKDRGPKYRNDVGVLYNTKDPAILIEFGFVNSKTDCDLMSAKFESICQAVAKELALVLGVKINKNKTPDKQGEVAANPTKKDTGTIKVLVDNLNYYDGPRWSKPIGVVKKNTILTVIDKVKVDGAWQYKLKSGTYITASDKYVKFTVK